MKIKVVQHNNEWSKKFNEIKKELQQILNKLNPAIEHIGSTAVAGLAAKPIIDIAIGVNKFSDLDKTIKPMLKNNYLYYKVYNEAMPDRRFFVGLKSKNDIASFKTIYKKGDSIPHQEIQSHKLCHIHVWKFDAAEWIRHIAFRDYVMEHTEIKNQYGTLKKQLSLKNWKDGNAYNNGKNNFIKLVEADALLWHQHKKQTKH